MPVSLYLSEVVIIFAFLDLGKNFSFSDSLLPSHTLIKKLRKSWNFLAQYLFSGIARIYMGFPNPQKSQAIVFQEKTDIRSQ